MPVRKRAPGRLDHFERAGDAGAVAWCQTLRGDQIAPRQFRVQGFDAVASEPCAQIFPYFRWNRRHRRQTLRQHLEIKPGAANENRENAPLARLSEGLFGLGEEGAGRKIHRGIDVTIEPVRNLSLLLPRRPRGEDREVAIYLHRVGIDDHAAGFLRQCKRERRLAAGGRPCDKHGITAFGSKIHPMSFVVTLICNPANPALDSTVIDGARALLPSPGPANWLFDEVAADIPFEGVEDIGAIERRLREARGDLPIDIVVQPRVARRKKLLLADMDSTMIEQECVDELADFAGVKARVAAITERAMRGEIEFRPALRERVALLKGLPVSVVDEVLKNRITLTSGGRELVATMRAHGAYACLISGGFTLFTRAVAAMAGFDENRANQLIVENGKLTGEVAEPVLGRAAKLATLVELLESFDLDDIDTLVVGDGANDLDMIGHAGLGVAYHAKPAVATAAKVRIDHGDLTALLYAQGYRREEFVGG
jgi:phosphoserine phosphatase